MPAFSGSLFDSPLHHSLGRS
uniref:Uncharacterized protein n=1 Tax=Anguilla anguilla TaxID=7936 RepID=A0A0E9XKE2_ANGAN